MKPSEAHPGERRILALLDGELSPEEEREVRAHCETCKSCLRLRDELASVGEALQSLPAAGPTHPIWPAVRERRRREDRPILRPVFGAAAAAAVAAGVFLGLAIGSDRRVSVQPESGTLWSVVGSSLADDGVSGAYARMAPGEERSRP